jgi:predicted metalloendopeptidase
MRQWWTNSTVEEYVNRSACFIEQYSSYRVEEIESWVRPQRVVVIMVMSPQRG